MSDNSQILDVETDASDEELKEVVKTHVRNQDISPLHEYLHLTDEYYRILG